MSRWVRNFFSGQVSRTTLLAGLLLGFASFFSTVIAGMALYPGDFDWRRRVMSRAISPHHNPDAYWIPALGVVAAALLFLPFAGYVEQRLRAVTPRSARWVGGAFTLGILLFIGVGVPLPADMPRGFRRLHEVFARASAGALAVGMVGCCWCAFKDWFRSWGGQRLLRERLVFCWLSLPLMLVGFGLICGLMLLGREAEMAWALQAGDVLRPTMFWQLAFWEWVGVVAFFGFLFVSALWLPEHARSSHPLVPAGENLETHLIGPEIAVATHVNGVNHHTKLNQARVAPDKLNQPRTDRDQRPGAA